MTTRTNEGLAEDPQERAQFNQSVKNVHNGNVLETIAAMLSVSSAMTPQQGSFSRNLAIWSNEVMKAAHEREEREEEIARLREELGIAQKDLHENLVICFCEKHATLGYVGCPVCRAEKTEAVAPTRCARSKIIMGFTPKSDSTVTFLSQSPQTRGRQNDRGTTSRVVWRILRVLLGR